MDSRKTLFIHITLYCTVYKIKRHHWANLVNQEKHSYVHLNYYFRSMVFASWKDRLFTKCKIVEWCFIPFSWSLVSMMLDDNCFCSICVYKFVVCTIICWLRWFWLSVACEPLYACLPNDQSQISIANKLSFSRKQFILQSQRSSLFVEYFSDRFKFIHITWNNRICGGKLFHWPLLGIFQSLRDHFLKDYEAQLIQPAAKNFAWMSPYNCDTITIHTFQRCVYFSYCLSLCDRPIIVCPRYDPARSRCTTVRYQL